MNIENVLLKKIITSLFLFIFAFSILVGFSYVAQKSNAQAETNVTSSFQGKIVRNDAGYEGLNVTSTSTSCINDGSADTCDFRVTYYDAGTGGTTLYIEDFLNIEIGDYDGVFNLPLGDGTEFAGGSEAEWIDVFNNNSTVHAEVKFDPSGGSSFTETFDRMAVRATPFAVNSEYLGGVDSSGFVQLAPGATPQDDASTTSSIFIDKTGASGNILQLQKDGNDVLVLDNSGSLGIGNSTPGTTLAVGSVGTNATTTDGFEDGTLTPFTTSGDASWFVQSTTKNAGTYAVEAGNIGDNEKSVLEYSDTLTNPSEVTFYVSTSSEADFDFITFYIDDIRQEAWSGTTSWEQYRTFVSAGAHVFKWVYDKDGGTSTGSDTAYIDDFVIYDQTTDSSFYGAVGIGTETPNYALDVNGVINTRNSYTIDGMNALSIIGDNIMIGDRAGENSGGFGSVLIGNEAGMTSQGSWQNTIVGYQAGRNSTTGTANNFFGFRSGQNVSTGDNNVGFGSYTLKDIATGGNNVALGHNAGYTNADGSGNVFLGYEAGYSETGSNTLYIENSNSATPLIGGDFSTDEVYVNGTLGVGTTSPSAAKLVIAQSDAADLPGIVIDTEETTSTQDVFKIISDVDGDETGAFQINAQGHIGIAGTATSATSYVRMIASSDSTSSNSKGVYVNMTDSGSSSTYGLGSIFGGATSTGSGTLDHLYGGMFYSTHDVTSTGSLEKIAGAKLDVRIDGTASVGNSADEAFILFGQLFHTGSGTVDIARGINGAVLNWGTGHMNRAYGSVAGVTNYSGGTIDEAKGISGDVFNQSTGTIANAYGGWFEVGANAGAGVGKITSAYGINVLLDKGTGSADWDNSYGIYLDDQGTMGTVNNYAIYSDMNGDSYFRGTVGIGTDTPAAAAPGSSIDTKLHLYGNGSGTAGRTGLVLENGTADSAASFYIANSDGNFASLQVSGPSYVTGDKATFGTKGLDISFGTDGNLASGGTHDIIFKVGGYEATNEFVSFTSDHDVTIFKDSSELIFGEGGDASITYDGSDFVFNSRVVGSGDYIFNGGNLGIGDTSPASALTVGNGDLFQVDSSGEIASVGGVAHTIADTTGDLHITSNADLFFNDSVQTSAIALSDTDDGFDGSATAIIDAINEAYNAASGGLWLDGGDYAYLDTGSVTNIATAEDSWLGIGSAAERIVFDGTGGDISIMGATVGIGTTSPGELLSLFDTGTAKANLDILSITNDVNAVDMDGTQSSILFNQYYYDASTPAVGDAGRISVGTEQDWTSTTTTQDSYLSFSTALDGTVSEVARFNSDGDLIPYTDDSQDLGSTNNRWQDLYLGPQSLHLGTDGNELVLGYDTTLSTITMGSAMMLFRDDTTTLQDDLLGEIAFDSTDQDLSTLDASAVIRAYAAENHGIGDKGGYISFYTKSINTNPEEAASEKLRIGDQDDTNLTFFSNTGATGEQRFKEGQGFYFLRTLDDASLNNLAGMTLEPTFSYASAMTADRVGYGFEIDTQVNNIDESTFNYDIRNLSSHLDITDGSTLDDAYAAYNYAQANHTTGTVGTLYGAYNLAATDNGGTTETSYGAYNSANISNGSGTTLTGSYNRAQLAADGSTDAMQGIYALANNLRSTGTTANSFGAEIAYYKSGAGTVTNGKGIEIETRNVLGTTENAYGLDSDIWQSSTGSITTAFGVQSSVRATAGSITTGYAGDFICDSATTCYGLRVRASDTTPTTNYGIRLNASGGTGDNWGIWGENGDWVLDENGNGASGGTSGGGDLLLGGAQQFALYFDGTDSNINSTSGDLKLTGADDIIFDDVRVSSITLSAVDTTLPNGNTGIVDAINDAYNAATGGTVTSVSNVDGTLSITPTTGAVVASLDLTNANSWTGLQTFSGTSTYFARYLTHGGDTDTYLDFTPDNLGIWAGNEQMISLLEDDTQDILELGDDGDIDIKLSAGADGALFVQGSTGNVGIGSTNPDALLHVSAGASGVSSPTEQLVVENNGHVAIGLFSPDVNTSTLRFGSATDISGARMEYDYTNTALTFGTSIAGGDIYIQTGNNVNTMSLYSGGDVGIGLGTDTPTDRLHVGSELDSAYTSTNLANIASIINVENTENDTATNNRYALIRFSAFNNTQTAQGQAYMGVVTEGDSKEGDMVFLTRDSNNRDERMRITSEGYVGIGNTNPGLALDVTGVVRAQPGTDIWAFQATESDSYGMAFWGKDSATRWVLGSSVTGDAVWRFTLNTGGKMEWGGGASATDVNLYRDGANILKTDDSFVVGGDVTVEGGDVLVGNDGTVQFGSATETITESSDSMHIAGAANTRIYVDSNNDSTTEAFEIYHNVAEGTTTGSIFSVTSAGTSIDKLNTPYEHTITVAKSGGDYTTISAALTSITDNSATNLYVIKVMPGIYTESVTMKDYVDLEGAGIDATIINGNSVFAASYSTIEDLTIRLNGTHSYKAGLDAFTGAANGADPTYIRDAKIEMHVTNGPIYPLLIGSNSMMYADNVIIEASAPPHAEDGLYAVTSNTGGGNFRNLTMDLTMNSGSATRDDVGAIYSAWSGGMTMYNSVGTFTNNATSNNTNNSVIYGREADIRVYDSNFVINANSHSTRAIDVSTTNGIVTVKNLKVDLNASGSATVYGAYNLNEMTIEDSIFDIDQTGTGAVYGVYSDDNATIVTNSTFDVSTTSSGAAYGIYLDSSNATVSHSNFYASSSSGNSYGTYTVTSTCNPEFSFNKFAGGTNDVYVGTGCVPVMILNEFSSASNSGTGTNVSAASDKLVVGTYTPSASNKVHFYNNAANGVLRVQDSSNWCDANPAGSMGWTCSSDERLKSDIIDAPDMLDYLLGIPIKEFTWNSSGERDIGTIAQEMQAAGYDELVLEGEDGYLGVRNIDSWSIVKAIQEQDVKIGDVGTRVDAIELDLGSNGLPYNLDGDLELEGGVIAEGRDILEEIDQIKEKEVLTNPAVAQMIADYEGGLLGGSDPSGDLAISGDLQLGGSMIIGDGTGILDLQGGLDVDSIASQSITSTMITVANLGAGTINSTNLISDVGNITGLTADTATIATLDVGEGMFIVNETGLEISADLVLDGILSSTLDVLEIATKIKGTDGRLEVEGTLAADEVETKQVSVDRTDVAGASAGVGTILAGEEFILIETTAVLDDSLVFVTAQRSLDGSIPTLAVDEQLEGEFKVYLDQISTEDVQFNWWVVK